MVALATVNVATGVMSALACPVASTRTVVATGIGPVGTFTQILLRAAVR